MARFYFHIEHVKIIRDNDGSDHETLDAAKLHAVKRIADILSHEPESFWDSDVFRMTVAQADGLVLFTLDIFAQLAPAAGPFDVRRAVKPKTD